MASFKVPKVIYIVSALPKNALGKVERRALLALCNPTLVTQSSQTVAATTLGRAADAVREHSVTRGSEGSPP